MADQFKKYPHIPESYSRAAELKKYVEGKIEHLHETERLLLQNMKGLTQENISIVQDVSREIDELFEKLYYIDDPSVKKEMREKIRSLESDKEAMVATILESQRILRNKTEDEIKFLEPSEIILNKIKDYFEKIEDSYNQLLQSIDTSKPSH